MLLHPQIYATAIHLCPSVQCLRAWLCETNRGEPVEINNSFHRRQETASRFSYGDQYFSNKDKYFSCGEFFFGFDKYLYHGDEYFVDCDKKYFPMMTNIMHTYSIDRMTLTTQVRQRSVIVRNDGAHQKIQQQQQQDDKEDSHALSTCSPYAFKVSGEEEKVTKFPMLADCKTKRDLSNSKCSSSNISSISSSTGCISSISSSIDSISSIRDASWPQALHWGFARQLNPVL